jgi:hypothetical protein
MLWNIVARGNIVRGQKMAILAGATFAPPRLSLFLLACFDVGLVGRNCLSLSLHILQVIRNVRGVFGFG